MTEQPRPRMGGLARQAAVREARLSNTRYQPGMLVAATVRPMRESPELGPNSAVWKNRPVILVGKHRARDWDGLWRVMGLTTKPTFEDGKPRERLSDDTLNEPSYLWSPTLVIVPMSDLLGHIGWVTSSQVEQLIEYSSLTADERSLLRKVARG